MASTRNYFAALLELTEKPEEVVKVENAGGQATIGRSEPR